MDDELKALLGIQIADLEARIEIAIAADPDMASIWPRYGAGTARILRSICGVGPVTSWMLIAEMPELGQISGEQAAALRHVLLQAALVASHT